MKHIKLVLCVFAFLLITGCTSTSCNKEIQYCPVKEGKKVSAKDWIKFRCGSGGSVSIRAGDMKASKETYCHCMMRKHRAVCRDL
jgi:hypothetical protein